jgi:hypothetical protein
MPQSKLPLPTDAAVDDAVLANLKSHAFERTTPSGVATDLDKTYEMKGEIFDGNDGRTPAIVVYNRATERGGTLAVTESLNRLARRHPRNVIFDPETETYYWQD